MSRAAGAIACAALVAVVLVPQANCGAATVANRYGGQPEFTAAPRPLAPTHVAWRASRPLTRGLEMWASGRRDLATKWFEAAVRALPGDPVAWHNLGVAYFCASRFDESFMCFQHEKFLYVVAPSALYGMAMCHMARGKPELAENCLAMAVAAAPREWEYWHRFAQALALQGKVEASRVAADRAARLKPRPRLRRLGVRGIENSILTLRFPVLPHS